MEINHREERVINIPLSEILVRFGIDYKIAKDTDHDWNTYGDTLQIRLFKDKNKG